MSAPGRKPHIVLIEDSDDDAFLVQYTFRKRSLVCEITRFDEGEAAFEAMSGSCGLREPDLILLDLNLPLHDGLEILKALRGNPAFAHTPVAVFTSSLAPRDQEEAMRLGADRYVQKPSGLKEFVETVGNAVIELLGMPPEHTSTVTTVFKEPAVRA